MSGGRSCLSREESRGERIDCGCGGGELTPRRAAFAAALALVFGFEGLDLALPPMKKTLSALDSYFEV